jgi:hypothetical protein
MTLDEAMNELELAEAEPDKFKRLTRWQAVLNAYGQAERARGQHELLVQLGED